MMRKLVPFGWCFIGLRNIIKPVFLADIEKFNAYIEEHHAKAEEKGFEGYKYATRSALTMKSLTPFP